LVRDGTYAIDIKAIASGGGVLQTESGLVVDGSYKPGHYATTVQDLTVNAANIPINIQRTYDSTDKTQEDFGIGWSIGLSDFRVDTNGPLGAGGWTSSSCGLLGSSVCYASTFPHVVTVTWPDGHVEKFDMTPAAASGFFFGGETTSAFTAEPGSTSTLQAVDNGIISDGNGNFLEGSIFGSNGIYDPTEFILTAQDGTQYDLDRHLGLVGETDPNGNTITIDATGIHSSSGPSVTFNRDANDNIIQIVGPTGTVNYTYSAAGDLTEVQYPNGTTQSYTYDAYHDLLSISGDGQIVRTLTYDSSGRITAVTDGNGNTTSISTNVAGHQQVFTDATGQLTTVNTYDDRGDLIEQDQTYGGKTVTSTATYDSVGDQLSFTDGNGNTSNDTYDSSGDLLTSTDADGHTTTYTYNAFGKPLSVTDAIGRATTNTYDSVGNLLTTTDPNGHTTTDTYDSSGHLLTQTDPLGRVSTYTYDATGQVATITDSGGNVTMETHDPNSGLLTSITSPDGAKTSFTYDPDGNPLTMTDANGHVWSATHDAFDRVTSQTDPQGRLTAFSHDAAGNLISTTNPDGQTITYSYDADSRLVQKVVPGAGTTTYSYDPLGRLVGAANSTAQLAFAYDNAGHLLSATTTPSATSSIPTSTFTYSYDPTGAETSVTGPGGETTYGYDADQRLTSVTDPSSGTFSESYDPAGELTAMTRPNNVNDTLTYDVAGDVTSLQSTDGSALLNQADYSYNPSGLVSSFTNTTGTTTYGYDAAGQLTSAIYPAGSGLTNDTFTYDAVGNRTSSASSPSGSFSYGSADQLQSDVNNTYTYDGEGDLLTKTSKGDGSSTTYTWTAEHQLTGISYADGSSSSFLYDPLGRLVQQVDGETVTRYAYDRGTIGADYDGSNSLSAAFVDDPTKANSALEMSSGGQRYFYLTDRQGSTTALTNMSGSVAASYKYSVFGSVTESGSLGNPFTLTGQNFDSKAGLYLFPLRPYDPSSGRFLAEDPSGSLNPYPYVEGSPPNATDPSGGDALVEFLKVTAIVIGVTNAAVDVYQANNTCKRVFAVIALASALLTGFAALAKFLLAAAVGGVNTGIASLSRKLLC
jgi:RHS repeat-associated protein